MYSSTRAAIASRPLVANCVTYGLLYCGSEFLQQTILIRVLGEADNYDLGALARCMTLFTHFYLGDMHKLRHAILV